MVNFLHIEFENFQKTLKKFVLDLNFAKTSLQIGVLALGFCIWLTPLTLLYHHGALIIFFFFFNFYNVWNLFKKEPFGLVSRL
jgi:hypothetical protein